MRSVPDKVKYGVPGLTAMANYTNRSLPQWGVPPNMCTPGGVQLLERTGADMVARGLIPASAAVAIVSDTAARDIESSHALARGLGRGEEVVSLDAPLFDTLDPDVGEPVCSLSHDEAATLANSTRRRMAEVRAPGHDENAAHMSVP